MDSCLEFSTTMLDLAISVEANANGRGAKTWAAFRKILREVKVKVKACWPEGSPFRAQANGI